MDIISRQKAIDAMPERIFQEIVVEYPPYTKTYSYNGKPYFSIKYIECGQEFIGFGTYKPEVLSEYLKKYFMPSAQPEYDLDGYSSRLWKAAYERGKQDAEPEIIHCNDCKYYNEYSEECDNDLGLRFLDYSNPNKMYCAWAERR